jgi:hypothetical protein
LLAHGDGHELRGLVLLGHRQGLGLGAAAGLVVAGECQEDDEPEQDREPGGQHPEHARGAVAVLEDAAGRGVAADEQQGAHAEPDRRTDDDDAQPEVHQSSKATARYARAILPG